MELLNTSWIWGSANKTPDISEIRHLRNMVKIWKCNVLCVSTLFDKFKDHLTLKPVNWISHKCFPEILTYSKILYQFTNLVCKYVFIWFIVFRIFWRSSLDCIISFNAQHSEQNFFACGKHVDPLLTSLGIQILLIFSAAFSSVICKTVNFFT